MGRSVSFVDTTILCNLLPVPGRDQDRDMVLAQLKSKIGARETLILPVTAVIETGNFIAQLSDGRTRRATAKLFSDMLELVIDNKAPWQLHQFMWDGVFLKTLIDGGGTGMTLVEHAVREMGSGDLCILTERAIYQSRARLDSVGIWTIDNLLSSYS